MSDFKDLSEFVSIRDQYAADLERAERELEKAKAKCEAARLKLQVADEMISKVAGKVSEREGILEGAEGRYSKMTFQEAVLDVIRLSGSSGTSAKRIQAVLTEQGIKTRAENMAAAILTACNRLEGQKHILSDRDDEGRKIFRPAFINDDNGSAENH